VDHHGNLYVADRFNHRVRKISVAGIVSTICGDGTAGEREFICVVYGKVVGTAWE
jgi:hypothetical protein